MDDATRAAFERLLEVTTSDTGQSRRVANFIFAWWNATASADSTSPTSSRWIVTSPATWRSSSPASQKLRARNILKAYRAEIENLIRLWRPEVWARSVEA